MSKRKGKQMSNLPHSYIEAMEGLQMENEQLRQRILILEKQAKNNEVLDLVMISVADVIEKFNGTIDDSEFAMWLEAKKSNES